VNVDQLKEQIAEAERALAAAGGRVFEQLNVRYSLATPSPSSQWAQDTLKDMGLEGNDLLIYPHRLEGYRGLLVTTVPARPLDAPWVPVNYVSIRGDVDVHWSHPGLNQQYAQWCSQKVTG
jgi:hypothetical protein